MLSVWDAVNMQQMVMSINNFTFAIASIPC
jgi:hypothetical protein